MITSVAAKDFDQRCMKTSTTNVQKFSGGQIVVCLRGRRKSQYTFQVDFSIVYSVQYETRTMRSDTDTMESLLGKASEDAQVTEVATLTLMPGAPTERPNACFVCC